MRASLSTLTTSCHLPSTFPLLCALSICLSRAPISSLVFMLSSMYAWPFSSTTYKLQGEAHILRIRRSERTSSLICCLKSHVCHSPLPLAGRRHCECVGNHKKRVIGQVSWTLADQEGPPVLRGGEALDHVVKRVSSLPGLHALLLNCCAPQAGVPPLLSLCILSPHSYPLSLPWWPPKIP